MSKQTAVEYLEKEFKKNGVYLSDHYWNAFEQAKQMEKEDLESAYFCGSCDRMNDEGSFEQYYKETYERENNKH